jgi:hypothetical protein
MNRPDRVAAARNSCATALTAVVLENGTTTNVEVREKSARLYTGAIPL